jgi:hypothetical protein
MSSETTKLDALRTLILKSQCESLSDLEIVELNELLQLPSAAKEAAALLDQLCAFTDSGSLDSLPMSELLSEARLHQRDNYVVPYDDRSAEARLGTPVDAASDANSTGDRIGTNGKGYWLLALAASHVLVAGLAWSLSQRQSVPLTERSPAERSLSERAKPLAIGADESGVALVSKTTSPQLVSMTACVWRPSGNDVPVLGGLIRRGEVLNLVEGIAEIRIGEETPGEALIRIEGPAGIFIHDDGLLELRHGSLTAKTLGIGSGKVTVKMPFGVIALDGQSSAGFASRDLVDEVHSFGGRALVKHAKATTTSANIVLEEGDAVRFSTKPDDDFEIVRFEASLTSFASARSNGFDPLEIGEKYVDAVMESKPNIYWRFEELSGDDTLQYVPNQGSEPNMNARIVGEPGWRQYGGNRVAELGTSAISSAFRATEPWPKAPLDEYTIELWVKPQLYHHGEVICLHDAEALNDGRYPHTMMLESIAQHFFTHKLKNLEPNRFRFVHRTLRSSEPIAATSLLSRQQYQARIWQHVVAQKSENRQLLWVDGRLAAETTNLAPLSENVQILVGQVYPTSAYRRFVGQVDEIAIYDRCLTPQEFRKHIHAAGRSVAAIDSN